MLGDTATTSVMSTILTAISTVFESIVGMVGDVLELYTTTGNEILLVALVLPLAGVAITFVKRLINNRY